MTIDGWIILALVGAALFAAFRAPAAPRAAIRADQAPATPPADRAA